MSDPHDYDDEFGPDSEDDGEWDDCGLMSDGQCTKAGSEECDWICGALDREPLISQPNDQSTASSASLATIPTTCIEHQAGRPTQRLSFQIKVF